MYLNKKNLFLVISICLIFFFLTYFDVKSKEIKIIDGDTIHLNGEKIRFSGIDTPEIKQTCVKNNEVIKCGIKAKELLVEMIGNKKINCIREGKDQYKRTRLSNNTIFFASSYFQPFKNKISFFTKTVLPSM